MATYATWCPRCKKLVLIFLAIVAFASSLRFPSLKKTWRLHVDMHYAKQCNGKHIMDCTSMTFRQNSVGELLYNAECTILRETKVLTEAYFNLTRCRDAVSYNTCEYFRTFRWTVQVCDLLTMTTLGSVWTQWRPRIICPVKPGNYSMVDAKIDLMKVALVDWPGYVWIGSALMRADQNDMFNCQHFQFKVTKVRSKPS